jgi:dTMP kinase
MHKNLFIAFEGIDGTGKSTQIALLAEKLVKAGHKVHTTFEPTDGEVGSFIRKILKGNVQADERVIAGLFVADRLDHLLNKETGLLKKMQEGYTVLTDRYYFSSYAYHSIHMDMSWVISANAMSASLLKPDINVFIEVPPEVCIERINAGRESLELYENVEILKKVEEKYHEAFELLSAGENILKINGNRSPDEVSDDLWKKLKEQLSG